MAGIKNMKGLYHMRTHVSQDIRGQFDVANQRDDQSPTMMIPA